MPVWLKNYGPEQVEPIIGDAFKFIKEQGAKKIASVGYCFGAKVCFISYYHIGIICVYDADFLIDD